MKITIVWTTETNRGDCNIHLLCGCGKEHWFAPRFTGTIRCDCGESLPVVAAGDKAPAKKETEYFVTEEVK